MFFTICFAPACQFDLDADLSDRSVLLPAPKVKEIQDKVTPKIVMCGMASASQAQVLNAFPQAYRVAYYDNFQQADEHRKNLSGLTKVRRCGPDKTKFVVKSGTPVKEKSNE